MVFGEIVEPSSRALCDDDFIEYPENDECSLSWSDNFNIPGVIENVYVAETPHLESLLRWCITIGDLKCELTPAAASIYHLHKNDYVVICKSTSKVIPGKITEKLLPWLRAATKIYILTSGTSLQNSVEQSPCIIRTLCNATTNAYTKLEVPNLITGLSASMFSACVHASLACTLFVAFCDKVPLDSINTKPLLDLMQSIGLPVANCYKLHEITSYSNLYL